VLGTSFNVRSVNNESCEITLVEGKVNVMSGKGASALLIPNQQAVVQSGSEAITTRNVNVEKYTSWKENILYFEEAKLKDAVAILENWYDIDIHLQNQALADYSITAKYKNEPLENVLESLEFLLNIRYTIKKGQVIIYDNDKMR